MKTHALTLLGKTISYTSKLLGRGNGSTWPGHIALTFQKSFIKNLLIDAPTKIILVVGTNGKTTTTKILSTILEESDYKVFENTSGANLLNGIASSLLLHTNSQGRLSADYAIFEVDENNLPLVLNEITPAAIVALDLFRDQLDRYGELDSIAKNWAKAFTKLPSSTHLILNSDDPLIAFLGKYTPASLAYFGLTDGTRSALSHAADTTYCPNCNHKLTFTKITYSHLGLWHCSNCNLRRPTPKHTEAYFPLDGIYNKYNTLAAVTTAKALGLDDKQIDTALHTVTPAFGRQEKLSYKGKHIQLFLSKNPTGFNESLHTITDMDARHVLLLLNDRVPDGTDVSWIWDIDLESYVGNFERITVSGDRTYDMALRVEYADKNAPLHAEVNLKTALQYALDKMPSSQTLYILPTYSAMLDIRKIVTGRKIL